MRPDVDYGAGSVLGDGSGFGWGTGDGDGDGSGYGWVDTQESIDEA